MNELFDQLAPHFPVESTEGGQNDIKKELWIKADFDTVLVRDGKVAAKAPFIVRGKDALVRLEPLALYTGKEIPATLAKVAIDGAEYARVEDAEAAFGLHHFYNPGIGLCIFSEVPTAYVDDPFVSLDQQIIGLADLLFEHPTGAQILSDIHAHTPIGQHPRIGYTKEQFDLLHDYYLTKDEDKKTEHDIVCAKVDYCRALFDRYFVNVNGKAVWKSEKAHRSIRHPYYIYDENGKRLVGQKEYTYTDENGNTVTVKCGGTGNGDGFDYGGRLYVTPATRAVQFAEAFQFSRDPIFKDAMKIMVREAANWQHWCEGHFLNCADACSEMSRALDWMWNEFDDEPGFRDEMAHIIYAKGLRMGYLSMQDYTNPELHHYATRPCSPFRHKRDNWNTHCGGGLTAACFVLADYPEFREAVEWVLETTLEEYKLCLVQYAPDGAYVESPSYWTYGTDPYINIIKMYRSVTGKDYGLVNTVGLKDSYYFGYYISDQQSRFWGYHDCGVRPKNNCSTYFDAAELFGDPTLGAFHRYLFGNEIKTVKDILNKDKEVVYPEYRPLDYRFRAIDTVTMRDSFDKENFIFTGLHAGFNQLGHGDMDSGNFVLEMGGVSWFSDPGSEDYNVGNYWGSATRYRYFRKSTEGHNVILVRDLPYGQVMNDRSVPFAHITKFEPKKESCLAEANMVTQYGEHCTAATRRVELTDGRRVVVVSDELHFDRPTHITWVATPDAPETVAVSEDGKVLTMTRKDEGGKVHTLEAEIVTDVAGAKFALVPADEVIIPETVTKKNSGNPRASDAPARVMIDMPDLKDGNLHVVFRVDGIGSVPKF